jgi:hypothetical protein
MHCRHLCDVPFKEESRVVGFVVVLMPPLSCRFCFEVYSGVLSIYPCPTAKSRGRRIELLTWPLRRITATNPARFEDCVQDI